MQVSLARQVRTTLNKPGERGLAIFVTVERATMVTFVPSQISTLVGAIKAIGVPHSRIRLAAQLIAGGVVSTRVTVWLHIEELVQASVAIQVRVALNNRGQRGLGTFVTVLTTTMLTFVSLQMSSANGGLKSQGVPHSRMELEAQVKAGGVVSMTVIVWLQVKMFVQESVACQVRVALKLLPQ